MTQIYCDIADINTIKIYSRKKIVRGFTTNPSLMRAAGAKNYELYSKEILKICKKKPISFEVFADDYKDILKQAHKIKSWGRNVYVKIPVENSKGVFMGKVIHELSEQNIKMNITAVYTHRQTIRILSKVKKSTNMIISIFAGRGGDVGKDPIPEIKKSISSAKKFKNVKILWASVREPYNFTQASQLGCHIITIPPKIISKIERFGKSFKELTNDTVKAFLVDSRKSKFKI